MANLQAELATYKEQGHGDLAAEVKRLKLQLEEQKRKNKRMWRLQCTQSQEQEDVIAQQQREIDRLKGTRNRDESPLVVEPIPLVPDSDGTPLAKRFPSSMVLMSHIRLLPVRGHSKPSLCHLHRSQEYNQPFCHLG